MARWSKKRKEDRTGIPTFQQLQIIRSISAAREGEKRRRWDHLFWAMPLCSSALVPSKTSHPLRVRFSWQFRRLPECWRIKGDAFPVDILLWSHSDAFPWRPMAPYDPSYPSEYGLNLLLFSSKHSSFTKCRMVSEFAQFIPFFRKLCVLVLVVYVTQPCFRVYFMDIDNSQPVDVSHIIWFPPL